MGSGTLLRSDAIKIAKVFVSFWKVPGFKAFAMRNDSISLLSLITKNPCVRTAFELVIKPYIWSISNRDLSTDIKLRTTSFCSWYSIWSCSLKSKAFCDLTSISSISLISKESVTGSIFTFNSPEFEIFRINKKVIIKKIRTDRPIKYISILCSIKLQQILVLD